MKINEAEQIVGIAKKNIRFYEEQGLLRPGRNKENGYRIYSQADAQTLLKIKLLRQLRHVHPCHFLPYAVPICTNFLSSLQ